MTETYFGRGNCEQFEEYMDFINYVFGFNGRERDFVQILPKLYRPELNPAKNSFIAAENGRIKATVGVFPAAVNVCGQSLKVTGIGNVAVHPYARSRGYMRRLMTMAVEDMITQGVDYSFLGGMRPLYNRFSYETAGLKYNYYVTENNLRYTFKDKPLTLTMQEVKAEDTEFLDAIASMSDSRSFAPVRARTELFSILCSWQSVPYIFMEGEDIVGYCIIKDNAVGEIYAYKDCCFMEMVRTIVHELSDISIILPDFHPTYAKELEPVAERVSLDNMGMFTIYNYKNVITAYLRLKASYTKLPSGSMAILIHGVAGDEALCISVKNGEISVTETDEAPVSELDHLQAIRYFFSPCCTYRQDIPDFAKIWFPLPLWCYYSDYV